MMYNEDLKWKDEVLSRATDAVGGNRPALSGAGINLLRLSHLQLRRRRTSSL